MGDYFNHYLALARGIPSNCAQNANVIGLISLSISIGINIALSYFLHVCNGTPVQDFIPDWNDPDLHNI